MASEQQDGNANASLHIIAVPHGNLTSLLEQGHLSDLTIQLEDGTTYHAHRVVLAGTSDVLKAKFIASFGDSTDHTWSPDVGSACAWHWIIGWIYGRSGPLPSDLFVETLLIADHLQMTSLVQSMQSFPAYTMVNDLVLQLLNAWAWPDALHEHARQCFAAVHFDRALLGHLKKANLQNLAAFVKWNPAPCESDRLRILGSYLRRKHEAYEMIPDCCIDSIKWSEFPAHTLEQYIMGDANYFEDLLGQPLPVSEKTKQIMVKALACRCQNLEQHLKFDIDGSTELPTDPSTTGLFARIAQKRRNVVNVVLSSTHECCKSSDPHEILWTSHKNFGTSNQTSSNEPWIELKTTDCVIRPRGIGLRHGWGNSDRCQSFVVEAAFEENRWCPILVVSSTPLQSTEEIFPISEERFKDRWFNRFRIRMSGASSTNDWYLMVSWFDIFGSLGSYHLAVLDEETSASI